VRAREAPAVDIFTTVIERQQDHGLERLRAQCSGRRRAVPDLAFVVLQRLAVLGRQAQRALRLLPDRDSPDGGEDHVRSLVAEDRHVVAEDVPSQVPRQRRGHRRLSRAGRSKQHRRPLAVTEGRGMHRHPPVERADPRQNAAGDDLGEQRQAGGIGAVALQRPA